MQAFFNIQNYIVLFIEFDNITSQLHTPERRRIQLPRLLITTMASNEQTFVQELLLRVGRIHMTSGHITGEALLRYYLQNTQ
jgi:hypothetical protein